MYEHRRRNHAAVVDTGNWDPLSDAWQRRIARQIRDVGRRVHSGRPTFELSGGEAVRLNEGLGVTDGGKARYGLNATDPAAARRGALKTALTFTERQRP